MSPDWSVFDYSQGLRNDKDLVEAFSELSFLEQEFCKSYFYNIPFIPNDPFATNQPVR